jgi:hypothetical protein
MTLGDQDTAQVKSKRRNRPDDAKSFTSPEDR